MQSPVHFLLTPDSSCSRRLRRQLAKQSTRMGVLVGTWPELIEQACTDYLILPHSDDWNNRFHESLGSLPEAFWFNSFGVSPVDTAAEVEGALSLVVSATSLNLSTSTTAESSRPIVLPPLESLPERLGKRIKDIQHLLLALEDTLPGELKVLQQLISADSDRAIRKLVIAQIEDFPALTLWQQALIEKLNDDAGVAPDPDLLAFLRNLRSNNGDVPVIGSRSSASTASDTVIELPNALAYLQQHLFTPKADDQQDQLETDNTVQWTGVRDYLEEAEVAAGMVQQILSRRSDVIPAEIGLLIPESFEYALAVGDAFTTAGLPLSGLPVDHWQRNLGYEALFHFLYCRQKPYPAMAMAVCLSSPLMPWSDENGATMAQAIMDGNYKLRSPHWANAADRQMLELLRGSDDTPGSLAKAIRSFVDLMVGDEFHLYQARSMANTLCNILKTQSTLDWSVLRRLSAPGNIITGGKTEFNQDGVTVWQEGHEPWRPVRFLIVLGFCGGHYPRVTKVSSVFVAEDLLALQQAGLPVSGPDKNGRLERERFQRQLGAVSEFVNFMIPRMDAMGGTLVPSNWLIFMAQLFRNIDTADSLVLEIDVDSDRQQMNFLPSVECCEVQPPREITATDMEFDCDLLGLRVDESGNQKPESPSSLETLMVSRLAWLLRRLNAEPTIWQPESPDALILGTLTHKVFETLFQAGQPVPDREQIIGCIPRLLDSAISEHAPYLRSAQWQVEQKQLAASISTAALAWGNMLITLRAEILATEVWLKGWLTIEEDRDSIPIHGQADCVLGLPGGELLVVDYKKASSGGRRGRMQNGFDSQLDLYRIMLQTEGLKDEANEPLRQRLKDAEKTGVLYFMANDQTALAAYTKFLDISGIPGWETIPRSALPEKMYEEMLKSPWQERLADFTMETSASTLIKLRLKQARQGKLVLNRPWESEFFQKFGSLTPYAMDNSPLISMFCIPDDGLWIP